MKPVATEKRHKYNDLPCANPHQPFRESRTPTESVYGVHRGATWHLDAIRGIWSVELWCVYAEYTRGGQRGGLLKTRAAVGPGVPVCEGSQ